MKKSKAKAQRHRASRPKTANECLRACGIEPDTPRPEMTTEWQVTPGHSKTTHVFTSPGKVFSFLASEWATFVTSWDLERSCTLSVEVRRVEREKHGPVSP